MENLTQIIIAIISSGVVTAVVTHFLGQRKYKAEIEGMKQQIEAARTDNQIKIDEHIQAQFMEIANSYKAETEARKKELEDLRAQNAELVKQVNDFQKQINDLEVQINQLMSWVAYDMMRYQSWMETELLKVKPDIVFPEYGKPPKFVQKYLEEMREDGDDLNKIIVRDNESPNDA